MTAEYEIERILIRINGNADDYLKTLAKVTEETKKTKLAIEKELHDITIQMAALDTAADIHKNAVKDVEKEYNSWRKVVSDLGAIGTVVWAGFTEEVESVFDTFVEGLKTGIKFSASFIPGLYKTKVALEEIGKAAGIVTGQMTKWMGLDDRVKQEARTQRMEDYAKILKVVVKETADLLETSERQLEEFGMSEGEKTLVDFERKAGGEGGLRSTEAGNVIADMQREELERNLKLLQVKVDQKSVDEDIKALKSQLLTDDISMTDQEIQHLTIMGKIADKLKEMKGLSEDQKKTAYDEYEAELTRQEQFAKRKDLFNDEKALRKSITQGLMTDEEKALADREEKMRDLGYLSREEIEDELKRYKILLDQNKAIQEQAQARKRLEDTDKQIQDRIDEANLTDRELALKQHAEDLAKTGRPLTPEGWQANMDKFAKRWDEMDKAIKDAQNREELENMTKALIDQGSVLGMTAGEAAAYQAQLRGANQATQDLIEGMTDYIEAFKGGEALMEKFLTPMEKYSKKVQELDKWHKLLGASFDKTYKEAIKEAQKELEKEQLELRVQVNLDNQSVRRGTAEYYKLLSDVANRQATVGLPPPQLVPVPKLAQPFLPPAPPPPKPPADLPGTPRGGGMLFTGVEKNTTDMVASLSRAVVLLEEIAGKEDVTIKPLGIN